MRIFLDDRGYVVFTHDGQLIEGNLEGNYASQHEQGVPEDWYPECKPKIEFTSSEVHSIIETLIEVLQNK